MERNVMLNEMAALSGNGFVKVTPAPPRTLLLMFNGSMTIQDFRDTAAKVRLVYPPCMVVEQQHVEEVDVHQIQRGARYIPLDDEKLKRFHNTKETIKLKRMKPKKGRMPVLDAMLTAPCTS